ncbi:sterol desaturase family protein [Flagellimonas zhangzhouensis]|uniref:Sterol desaturase/sphingolipid hydroxylase, fatty acid hydroxylase superfamily n=1 Tax=Flagellimonas zhangzhouensis TaxID=1073328 RepID=A0A1H2YXK1_9FLAO|nr:sterol desaturase family protein [Allomuricauda zhangzhouensis]SDR05024.1 Sterol desaturase/sphingolipid hydroxylase, fatty acid hydroxylase superfamily [Allomuricauda zhangzhouensis]SDX09910.1 Sterol desaturase/sphingolipid hydroxylase, fatty acid hydroxylase superfamily [Allomuricauda zhangzhouensis]
MESYATALLYATPFFIGLVLVEILYGRFVKNQKHNVMDTVSSLSSGLTNVVKDSLGLVLILVSYPFLLEHLALLEIKSTWLVWVVAFIALDFAGYWNHRLSHHINFFWNQHVIHHSSEEFNLACALRQPISNLLGYYALLLIPAAVLGVPEKVIAILAPIHLFAQFWYHTQHIGKMGWLEYVIVTPSQHRVHHAINKEYIDKNLGQIFCVWDRMFGTFQEELDEVPPQYGVLKPAETWNPIIINFQHLWRLMQDAWRTRNYLDKMRIWFMPTGWRPKDVKIKYPVKIIENVYNFKKYQPETSTVFKGYALFQLIMTTMLMLFMFYNYSEIGFDGLLLFGAYIFVGIYGYTTLMDRKSYAVWIEVIRGVAGLALIYLTSDWFGLDGFLPLGSYWVAVYFLITIFGGIYFTFFEKSLISPDLVS